MAVLATFWPVVLIGTSPIPTLQGACPADANPVVETGWTAYRSGLMDSARVQFQTALRLCPDHVGAQVGHAYALLQLNELESAATLFATIVRNNPNNIDAVLGGGLAAWRAGETERARVIFERVLVLEPDNLTAREFLARTGRVLGTPPERPPLVRSDTTVLPSRTHGGHFDILTSDGEWEPFYVKGINLGSAVPGKFATEFPDSITYATWLEQMGAMEINTIRVYTIHPPRFYNALATYNASHTRPLRLVHGAWATLPPNNDYDDASWKQAFFNEMHNVVDLIHGRADLPPSGDEGFRNYTSDISQWVIAFVFGREWEPQTIAGFNRGRGGRRDWQGRYVGVRRGSPAEVWMAIATDEMITYEMTKYGSQRPIAYTNWPTLDPLSHSSEATNAEEVAIITAMGGSRYLDPDAPNQDEESLDASRMFSTPQFPAGHFASYHAYPYHPDFMLLDESLRTTASSEGRSNYFGYLTRLKEHHDGVPVLIAEYGVPASWGIAHFQPQGWHHGGHTEAEQAAINARLTREIAEAGMAGGIVFSWIDEWFKRTWLTGPMTLPEERNRLWYNRLDPEQHYGIVAMEPAPRLSGRTIDERRDDWQAVSPLYTQDQTTVRALADESYLWLRIEPGSKSPPESLVVGFDLASPALGDQRWPGREDETTPVGLEFVVVFDGASVQILADSAVNPWLVEPILATLGEMKSRTELDELGDMPMPVFAGRVHRRANVPFDPVPNTDGAYSVLNVVLRRHRVGRDSTEFPAVGYNRGILRRGENPDGAWDLSETDGALEIRVPWMLINVTDPSSRNILSGGGGPTGPFHSIPIPSINIVIATRAGGTWTSVPARADSVRGFTWARWEQPKWRARPRPQFQSLRATFATLMQAVEWSGHN